MSKVSVIINDKTYDAVAGTNLLTFLNTIHEDVPQLCFHPLLTNEKRCRLCLVEDGQSGELLRACDLQIKENLQIKTKTQMTENAFQMHRGLVLSQHHLDCSKCSQLAYCRLGEELSIQDREWPSSTFRHHVDEKREQSRLSESLTVDLKRCIDCGLCVEFENMFSKSPALTMEQGTVKLTGHPIRHNMGVNLVSLCPVGCFKDDDFSSVVVRDNEESRCRGCDRLCQIRHRRKDEQVLDVKPTEQQWICDEAKSMMMYRQREYLSREASEDDREHTKNHLYIVPHGLDDDHYHWVQNVLSRNKEARWYLFSWSKASEEQGLLRANRNVKSKPLKTLLDDFTDQKVMSIKGLEKTIFHLFYPYHMRNNNDWTTLMSDIEEQSHALHGYQFPKNCEEEKLCDSIIYIPTNGTFTGINYLGEVLDS